MTDESDESSGAPGWVNLAGGGAATAYFAANPVTEHVTRTNTVAKPVSDNATVFTVYSGPEAPADWRYPVTVTFERPAMGNWTAAYVARVSEGHPFAVTLAPGARYRITVESAGGRERVVGPYVPTEDSAPVELVLFPCCSDDFSEVMGDA